MSDFLSTIDWELLGKWDVIFGITGGIISVFYGFRWLARHAKSGPFIRFISWSVTGDENEQTLATTLRRIIKLVGASLIWATIGALIGLTIISALCLLSSAMGSPRNSTSQALVQYACLGAFIGALFRGVIWPLYMVALNASRARAEAQVARRKEYDRQKERVEKKINRGRTE
jgi:hypothetical protein